MKKHVKLLKLTGIILVTFMITGITYQYIATKLDEQKDVAINKIIDDTGNNCFLAIENNTILIEQGDCHLRHSPCSTFKIAISCMAYNEELLIDETSPVLEFKEGYSDYLDNWKQDHRF